jgi:hypothetical protein
VSPTIWFYEPVNEELRKAWSSPQAAQYLNDLRPAPRAKLSRAAIVAFIAAQSTRVHTSAIFAAFDAPVANVRQLLISATNRGEIRRVSHGVYGAVLSSLNSSAARAVATAVTP